MHRVVLIDSDELNRRMMATQLRETGSEVIEATEEQALALFREGAEAMVVWNAKDAQAASALLSELDAEQRSSVWLFATSQPKLDPERPQVPPVSTVRKLLAAAQVGAAPTDVSPLRPELVGESNGVRHLRAALRHLARHPRTHVFVAGEVGSGKRTLAQALHGSRGGAGRWFEASARQLGELLAAPVDAICELGGTLYVPCIGDVPRSDQRRLAELLEERETRTGALPLRLVVGARLGRHRPLERFRREEVDESLGSRLAISLEVAPLRRRKCDIAALVGHFARAKAAVASIGRARFTEAALLQLEQHDWPGNVRELGNVVEQAVLLGGELVDAAHLPAFTPDSGIPFELPKNGVDFFELERQVLAQALTRSRGNQTRAASLLGLTRDQVRYRMSKFGMIRRIEE
jgi:DNA-binding NtrC family response regulator